MLRFDREAAAAAAPVSAPPGALPVVVLPGFGNVANDYIAPFGPGSEQEGLATQLRERGWRVEVVDVAERKAWFNVARALLTRRFWSSTLTTDPGYTW